MFYPLDEQPSYKNELNQKASIPVKKDSDQNNSYSTCDSDDSSSMCTKKYSINISDKQTNDNFILDNQSHTSSTTIATLTTEHFQQAQQNIHHIKNNSKQSILLQLNDKSLFQEIESEEEIPKLSCQQSSLQQQDPLQVIQNSSKKLKEIENQKQLQNAQTTCVKSMIREGIYGEFVGSQNMNMIEDNYKKIKKIFKGLKSSNKQQLDFVESSLQLQQQQSQYQQFNNNSKITIKQIDNSTENHSPHYEQQQQFNFQPQVNLLNFGAEISQNKPEKKFTPIKPQIDTKKIYNRWTQCRSLQTRFFNHVLNN